MRNCVFLAHTGNESPGQSARMRRLTWAFVVRLYNHPILWNVLINRECIDQIVRMRSMVWAFAVHICAQNIAFHVA